MRKAASVVLGFFLACTISSTVAIGHTAPLQPVRVRIPACQEDERYLKGKGDFYRDPASGESRWTRYVCINQDNFGG